MMAETFEPITANLIFTKVHIFEANPFAFTDVLASIFLQFIVA